MRALGLPSDPSPEVSSFTELGQHLNSLACEDSNSVGIERMVKGIEAVEGVLRALEKAGLRFNVGRISETEDYDRLVDIEIHDLPSYLMSKKPPSITLWGDEVYPYVIVDLDHRRVHLQGGWLIRGKGTLSLLTKGLDVLGFELLVDSLPLKPGFLGEGEGDSGDANQGG